MSMIAPCGLDCSACAIYIAAHHPEAAERLVEHIGGPLTFGTVLRYRRLRRASAPSPPNPQASARRLDGSGTTWYLTDDTSTCPGL